MAFPIPENETLRLEHLLTLGSGECGQDIAFQEICSIAASVMLAPVSLVSLLHEYDQRFLAKIGLKISGISRDDAFCAHTIMAAEPTLVADAAADKRFASNPLVIRSPHVRAYAGVALEMAPGIRVGTLCAMDNAPRDFSNQQVELLSKLGKVASSVLTSHKTRIELEGEIAARRRPGEQDLWAAALSDFPTGLTNLNEFRELASPLLEKAYATSGCALIIVDIDHLKSINHEWEHAGCDAYSQRVAAHLRSSVRKRDLVARLGAEDFAVLLTEIEEAEAVRVAGNLASDLRAIAEATGKSDLGRPRVGMAFAPLQATSIDDLYQFASAALRPPKKPGRTKDRHGSSQNDRRSMPSAGMTREYRRAIEAEEFVPYYQPKFELQKRTLTGFEALARWNAGSRGVLAPSQFLDLLDDDELASLLTKSMFMQMVKHLRSWRDLGLDCGSLAINACAGDFQNENFATDFLRIISDHNLQPRDFILEVTEKIILEDHDKRLFDALTYLKDHGVMIALDDFGTGYAGLQHLRKWPVNQIKIDRMFVHDCLKDSRDSAIVESIIQMSDAIGLGVTAEGIETLEQLELLRNLYCEMGQGDLFARPMSSADVPEYVRKFRQWH